MVGIEFASTQFQLSCESSSNVIEHDLNIIFVIFVLAPVEVKRTNEKNEFLYESTVQKSVKEVLHDLIRFHIIYMRKRQMWIVFLGC